METSKVEQIMMLLHNKLKTTQLLHVRQQLEAADDGKFAVLQAISFKEPDIVLIISILVGGLGIDRFYLEDIGMGVLKLLTGGGCGIWWLIDLFFVSDAARDRNYRQIQMVLNGIG